MNESNSVSNRFTYIQSVLDDCRKLIAANKAIRWDILKWAITVIVAVVGAFFALRNKDSHVGGWPFALSAWGVTIAASILVCLHSQRASRARKDAQRLEQEELGEKVVPKFIIEKRTSNDRREVWTYVALLIASALAATFMVFVM